MAVNPMQDILQMLMQQGGAGNIPAMQPGPQQAGGMGVAPQMPAYMDQAMPQGAPMPAPTGDPRFSGAPDPLRDETEGELADVRQTIRAGSMPGAEEGDWEGMGGKPTEADLEFLRENPTDGVLSDFFKNFPDYMRELILSEGGNPSTSPDEYAMSDEEWEETQSGRSTQTDEK